MLYHLIYGQVLEETVNVMDIVMASPLIRSWPTSNFSYSSIFIQIESRALAKRTNYCNYHILHTFSKIRRYLGFKGYNGYRFKSLVSY